jgi:hypothetical protein
MNTDKSLGKLSRRVKCLDLEDRPVAVAFNWKTGDFLLDEGYGPDRFQGAWVLFKSRLKLILQERTVVLSLEFIEFQHPLGEAEREDNAGDWVSQINSQISRLRKDEWKERQGKVKPKKKFKWSLPQFAHLKSIFRKSKASPVPTATE